MLHELIILVTGAALGVFVDRLWNLTGQHFRKSAALHRRRARKSREEALYIRVPELYQKKGGMSLYTPLHIKAPNPPMVTDSAIHVANFDATKPPELIQIDNPKRIEFPVDSVLIRKNQAGGANLWDGDVLYLRKSELEETPSGAVLHTIRAGVANYFSYVTSAERFRTKVLKDSNFLTNGAFRDLRTLLTSPPKPLALAAATACVFHTKEGVRVPIALRSPHVVNATGKAALVPTFGLESNIADGQESRFNVLTYNFLKEATEELFGIKEVIHNANSGNLDPDAILDNPLALALIKEFDENRASLRILGLSGELTDGTLTISLLAQFHSDDFYRRVRRHAKINWEWDEATHLHFHPLEDFVDDANPDLTRNLTPSSLVALDLAISHLKKEGWR